MAFTEKTVTIAANDTQSTALEIGEYTMMTLLISENLVSTSLSIQVRDSAGNWYDLMDQSGSAVSITIAADPSNDAVGIDAALLELAAASVIRFVAGSTETSGATIKVLLKR